MRRFHSRVVPFAACAAATVLIAAIPGAVAAAGPSGGCVTSSGTTTCTFDYTGAAEHWTVPAGVSSISIDASGGAGDSGFDTAGGAGGKGADVQATVAVSSGQILKVTVGGRGVRNNPNFAPGGFGYGTGGGSQLGGPGGGASSVERGSTVLLVAGAGGGGGTEDVGVAGGKGGDSASTGGNGANSGGQATGGDGGGPGTASSGGAGGNYYSCGVGAIPPNPNQAGSAGQGGAGGVGHGGGGGGGYYGGGGGGDAEFCIFDTSTAGAGGGGGGSSYTAPGATAVSVADGAHSGDGSVAISYAAVAGSGAPTMGKVSAILRANGGLDAAQITLSWSATDDVTSASQLMFQTEVRRREGGSWGAWQGRHSYVGVTHSGPEIPLWRTFQYRVRARDTDGNWSVWAVSKSIEAIRRGEDQFTLKGSWTVVQDSGATHDKLVRSSTAGSSATLHFKGNGVALLVPVNSSQGTVKICLDPGTAGQSCSTVDLATSSNTGDMRFVGRYVGLHKGPHVIRVTVVSGTFWLDGAVFTR